MIEEFARERKAVLSLDPRSGHIPNIDAAERFGGEGHVGVDEIVGAHCCAAIAKVPPGLMTCSGAKGPMNNGRQTGIQTFSPLSTPECYVRVDVRVTTLRSGCSLAYAHNAFSTIASEAVYTVIGSGQVSNRDLLVDPKPAYKS